MKVEGAEDDLDVVPEASNGADNATGVDLDLGFDFDDSGDEGNASVKRECVSVGSAAAQPRAPDAERPRDRSPPRNRSPPRAYAAHLPPISAPRDGGEKKRMRSRSPQRAPYRSPPRDVRRDDPRDARDRDRDRDRDRVRRDYPADDGGRRTSYGGTPREYGTPRDRSPPRSSPRYDDREVRWLCASAQLLWGSVN